MMNRQQACKLANKIRAEGYTVGIRDYNGAPYVIIVRDHVTGYTMLIESPADWAERERLEKVYS